MPLRAAPALLLTLLAPSFLLIPFSGPETDEREVVAPPAGHHHHHHGGACELCAEEPQLAEMLTLVEDPADPTLVRVEVAPDVEGRARLTVDRPDLLGWAGDGEPGMMRLRRGEAPREMALRKRGSASQGEVARVGLEIENERGDVIATVHKEIRLGEPPRRLEEPGGKILEGTGAAGNRVRASVPADAPRPVVSGGGQ